jgi:hypothetical protein
VWLRVDDSEDPGLNGARAFGRVTTIGDDSAQIQLDQPLRCAGQSLDIVIAIPRHRGYGFDHLVFGPIAVLLDRPGGNGATPFAIAVVRRAREPAR